MTAEGRSSVFPVLMASVVLTGVSCERALPEIVNHLFFDDGSKITEARIVRKGPSDHWPVASMRGNGTCVLHEIEWKEWKKRGWWHRIKDQLAYLVNEQL